MCRATNLDKRKLCLINIENKALFNYDQNKKDFGNLCIHSENHVNFSVILCVRKAIAER